MKRSQEHTKIVRAPFGDYELLLPTKLNEELKPLKGIDFKMTCEASFPMKEC